MPAVRSTVLRRTPSVGEVEFVLYEKVSFIQEFLNAISILSVFPIHFGTYTNVLYKEGVLNSGVSFYRGFTVYTLIQIKVYAVIPYNDEGLQFANKFYFKARLRDEIISLLKIMIL